MNLIKRKDPFCDLVSFDTGVDSLLESFFPVSFWGDLYLPHSRWMPPVDIREDENEVVISAELPGLDEKDVEVTVEDNTLKIRGERKFENEEKRDGYHRIERSYGSFQRSFTLPSTVKSDSIRADYKNGVLELHVPKTEKAKPKKIPVKTG